MPFLPAIGAAIGAAVGTAATAAGAALGATLAGFAGTAAGAGALFDVGFAIGSTAITSGLEIAGLAAFTALTAPKPKINTAGSPQSFKADPYAPIPVIMGRYGVGGNLIYETTTGGASKAEHGAAGNEYLTQFVVLGALGPYPGLESTRLDDTILTFGGQSCTGGYIEQAFIQAYNPGYQQNANGSYQNDNYKDHVWQVFQPGALNQGGLPYPTKIDGSGDAPTEWTAAHGVDGFAAVSITRSYDTSVWAGGAGQPMWVLSGGAPQYDPRKDSTYPGGSGPQRWPAPEDAVSYFPAARGTWQPSDNPIIHALNFALGYYVADPTQTVAGGRLYAGVGAGRRRNDLPHLGVDVDAFIRAANVADANGWKVTGQWTTQDGKRSVLVAMLQAGGAQLVSDRGRISCTISTPLTAVNADAPLTWADLAGAPTLDTTVGVRDRTNTVFYRYTSEAHRWQVVQADTPVEAATYVAEDGGVVRSKTLDFDYVPSVNQAAQLAAYAIVDGREIPNIVLPGKPHLRGYGPGDCVLVDLPEIGLHLQKLVVLKRSTDPATALVTLTCRTETDSKHEYALGRSGVAPATPSISGFDPTIVPAPIPDNWTATPTPITDAVTGEITHVIRIDGTTVDNVYAAQVVVLYAQVTTSSDGGDVEGPVASQTYPASQATIDLDLPAGRWHLWLRYITISGAEDEDNTLDLGVLTVDGTTAARAATITPDLLQSILDQAAEANGLTDQAIADALAKFGDDGEDLNAQSIALLAQQVSAINTRISALFSGLPPGPYVQEIATTSATSAETLDVMGVVTPNGLGFAFKDSAVSFADGTSLAAYRQGVSSTFGTITSTATQNFNTLSSAQGAQATLISAVQVQAGANGAAIVDERTARESADSSEAQARLLVTSNLGTLASTVQQNFITLTTADSTEATARLAVNSDYQSFKSSASTQLVTLADNDSTLSSQITSLNSDYGSFKSSATSQLSTLATNGSSYATSISSLTAQAGSLSSSVSINAGAIASLQGRTGAYFYVSTTGPSGQAVLALAADGYGSNVQLSADRIWFGQYTYYDTPSRTLQTRYNGRAKVIGSGFGSSGQFMEWSGPDVSLSSMSEGNALYYEKTDGSGFFAGGVIAGTTSASGRVNGGANPPGEIQTGDGGTNGILSKRGGNNKIDFSLTLSLFVQNSGSGVTNANFNASLTGNLQRMNGDGSGLTEIADGIQFNGAVTYERDGERGLNQWFGGISGSFSVTDQPGDGNYIYRFLITSTAYSGAGVTAGVTSYNFSIYAANNRG